MSVHIKIKNKTIFDAISSELEDGGLLQRFRLSDFVMRIHEFYDKQGVMPGENATDEERDAYWEKYDQDLEDKLYDELFNKFIKAMSEEEEG